MFVAISLFAVDRFCGLFFDEDYVVAQLALPPSEKIRYEARDFQFTVSTNRLGFRGPEFPLQKRLGVKRILVLGNSFTYGWGVDFELTWPHLLENELGALGIQVETANLATPGTSASEMISIAARSIPLLKPDLVIISVLQGGAVLTFNGGLNSKPDQERPTSVRSKLVTGLTYALPNYVSLLRAIRHRTVVARERSGADIRQAWQKEAKYFLGNMTDAQSQRYHALDPATAERFVNAALNIPVVEASIQNPDRFVETVRSEQMISDSMATIRSMFSEIRTISEANGAGVIAVSMPHGAYLGGGAAENIRRLGFNIPDVLSQDKSTEDQIFRAATGAHVKFISVLDDFQKANPDSLFIPFDGHFNGSGTTLYSQLLSKELFRLWPVLLNPKKQLQ